MPEERPPYETLLDAFVYAPLGAALVLVDELPRLAERGRERVEKRVAVARLVGKFAVEEARRRLGALSVDPFGGESHRSGDLSNERVPPRDIIVPTAPPQDRPAPHRSGFPSGPSVSGGARRTASPRSSGPAKRESGELPIPAYDTLAASQVVERLPSLTAAELELVRKHESAHRRRRTVLHRIAQLASEQGGASA